MLNSKHTEEDKKKKQRWHLQGLSATPQPDHASLPSKSSPEEPVAREKPNHPSRKLHIDAQLETPPPPPLLVSHHVWTVQVRRHAGSERNRAHDYSQLHKPTRLVLLPSLPAGAVQRSHPACQQDVIKSPSVSPPAARSFCFSFFFFFFFIPPPPQTEIPAFLCTLLLFGVLLSISISDMGESEVSVCLGAEVMGEEMWRRRRCHLIRSWRRLSGGRAIVGQGCCRGLVFMSTSLCGRETTLLKRWLEIEISSVTEWITGWITHTLLQFMHTMWTFLQ